MNLNELQTIVDNTALILGEKTKYKAIINPRLRRYHARAFVREFLRTGRRKMDFNKSYINSCSINKLALTIIHEITHFKLAEKNRRKIHKTNFRASNKTTQYNKFPYYLVSKERWHNKRFNKRYNKLITKFHNKTNPDNQLTRTIN